MKQATGLTLLLAACAVAGFLTFRFLAGDPSTAGATVSDAGRPSHLPEFILETVDGGERSVHDYLDGKPMVLNFWATWCPPCLREMPLLDALDREAGNELQVVGVAIDRMEPVVEFLNELGIAYPVLVGEQAGIEAAEAFGEEFLGLPFTVYTDARGEIIAIHLGELLAEDMADVREVMTAVARGEKSFEAARGRLETDHFATR